MASSTRQALAAAKEAISPLLGKADLLFAEELFTIGAAIASSIQLRNLLSDPSGEEKSKQGALAAVFGKAISKEALAFLSIYYYFQYVCIIVLHFFHLLFH